MNFSRGIFLEKKGFVFFPLLSSRKRRKKTGHEKRMTFRYDDGIFNRKRRGMIWFLNLFIQITLAIKEKRKSGFSKKSFGISWKDNFYLVSRESLPESKSGLGKKKKSLTSTSREDPATYSGQRSSPIETQPFSIIFHIFLLYYILLILFSPRINEKSQERKREGGKKGKKMFYCFR